MARPDICNCICHEEGEEPCSPPCCDQCVCGELVVNDWKDQHRAECEIYKGFKTLFESAADMVDPDEAQRLTDKRATEDQIFGEDPVKGD